MVEEDGGGRLRSCDVAKLENLYLPNHDSQLMWSKSDRDHEKKKLLSVATFLLTDHVIKPAFEASHFDRDRHSTGVGVGVLKKPNYKANYIIINHKKVVQTYLVDKFADNYN